MDLKYDWLLNWGFAALVAAYLLLRLEQTLKQLARQIELNTLALAHLTGLDMDRLRALQANGGNRQR